MPVDKVVEGIGIEMEEAYEHVEQLASGETVQPEDEEQEKTGPLTPEGTSTGGENVGNEEEGESEETQKLTLVTYISDPADSAAGIPFSGREKQLSCDSGGTASEGLYRCGNLSHDRRKRGRAGDRRGNLAYAGRGGC